MPRRDGTGPEGMGPMSGRKMGLCSKTSLAGSENNIVRPRYGRLGRRIENSVVTKEMLFQQKELLEQQLNAINKQLS